MVAIHLPSLTFLQFPVDISRTCAGTLNEPFCPVYESEMIVECLNTEYSGV